MRRIAAAAVPLSFLITGASGLARAHDRKEVAGLEVVFGAEPEPALTGELQHLRWRFRAPETKQPFSDLEELRAVVKRNGRELGAFPTKMSTRDAGMAQTVHIFTAAGDYEAVLTFRKKGESQVQTVAFPFQIRNRKELEIP